MRFDQGFSQILRELRETYRMGGIGITEWRDGMRLAGMPLAKDEDIFPPPRPLPPAEQEPDDWVDPITVTWDDDNEPTPDLPLIPDAGVPDISEDEETADA